jgi:hypothetical protein
MFPTNYHNSSDGTIWTFSEDLCRISFLNSRSWTADNSFVRFGGQELECGLKGYYR